MRIASVAILVLSGFAAGASAQAVDPEADRLLRAMAGYLGNLSAFTVAADIDDEVIDLAGQKLQLSGSGTVTVERPGHLYAHRQGPLADVEVLFDGQTLTLNGRGINAYMQTALTGGVDDALSFLRAEWDLDTPAGDIFYSDAYPGLMTEVTGGDYMGTATVGGIECHHLAYRAERVDWQIWIRIGEQPLPMKYIVTSKWLTGAPQYSVRFRDWATRPAIPAGRFDFTPAEGARKLERIFVNSLGAIVIEEVSQ